MEISQVYMCVFRTSLPAVEQGGYPATMSSHSVAARLSSESLTSRRGSEPAGPQIGSTMTRSVVTHVDAGGSNPLTSLSVGDIPLSRVPHTTPGECCKHYLNALKSSGT